MEVSELGMRVADLLRVGSRNRRSISRNWFAELSLDKEIPKRVDLTRISTMRRQRIAGRAGLSSPRPGLTNAEN